MKLYMVGGAVRDFWMGLSPKDRDWVVVGSTAEEMVEAGYKPVGLNGRFPVFLNPHTGEEFALARREFKTGPGYNGFRFEFGPEVTLEEDLGRRDLTINAIARDVAGNVYDPYGGVDDITNKVLRAVNPKAFIEDPLRVLRAARFRAKFPNFRFDGATADAATQAAPHLVEIAPERIYLELKKGLLTDHPEIFFASLYGLGALKVILPEIDTLFRTPENPDHHPEGTTGHHTLLVLKELRRDLILREVDEATSEKLLVAALFHDVGKGETPKEFLPRHPRHEVTGVEIAEGALRRLLAPVTVIQFTKAVVRQHMAAHRWEKLRSKRVLELVQAFYFDKERIEQFCWVVNADEAGRDLPPREGWEENNRNRLRYLLGALFLSKQVSGQPFVEKFGPGPKVGDLVQQERIRLINGLREAWV